MLRTRWARPLPEAGDSLVSAIRTILQPVELGNGVLRSLFSSNGAPRCLGATNPVEQGTSALLTIHCASIEKLVRRGGGVGFADQQLCPIDPALDARFRVSGSSPFRSRAEALLLKAWIAGEDQVVDFTDAPAIS